MVNLVLKPSSMLNPNCPSPHWACFSWEPAGKFGVSGGAGLLVGGQDILAGPGPWAEEIWVGGTLWPLRRVAWGDGRPGLRWGGNPVERPNLSRPGPAPWPRTPREPAVAHPPLSEVGLPRAADVQPSWGLCSALLGSRAGAALGPRGSSCEDDARLGCSAGQTGLGLPNAAPPARWRAGRPSPPRCRSSRERGGGRGGGLPRGRRAAPLLRRAAGRARAGRTPGSQRRAPHPSDATLSPERESGSGPARGAAGRPVPPARGLGFCLGPAAPSPPCREWAGGQGHSGPSRSVTRACLLQQPRRLTRAPEPSDRTEPGRGPPSRHLGPRSGDSAAPGGREEGGETKA